MSDTPRPIRIAAQLHPQHGDWRDIRAAAIRCEELGYDILYTWDHFSPLDGDPDGQHFECWSLLAAWAEATSASSSARWWPATRTATPTCTPTSRGPSTTSAAGA